MAPKSTRTVISHGDARVTVTPGYVKEATRREMLRRLSKLFEVSGPLPDDAQQFDRRRQVMRVFGRVCQGSVAFRFYTLSGLVDTIKQYVFSPNIVATKRRRKCVLPLRAGRR